MKEYKISYNPSTKINDDFANIPCELKARNQWVRYRIEDRQGKLTKVPLNPRTGQLASSTDPLTWGTFEEAINSRIGTGIGFAFTLGTGIVGIDLDHVIFDGEIESWAEEIVRECNSYTEISPSGEGLHIYVYGELPSSRRKKGQFECYGEGRYFTVTGNHLPGTPLTIEHRQEALLRVHARIFGNGNNEYKNNDTSLSDAEILKKASNALNGEKFLRLWQGNWNEYPSQSEADAALCGILAFYLGQDPVRIDYLFRRSGLMRRKWDEKHYSDGSTYGQKTISRILERNSNGNVSDHPGSSLSLPSINVSDDDLKTISGHAWDAFRAANDPPKFFRNGNLIVRIENDDNGRPTFRQLTIDRMRYHLARVADWTKEKKNIVIPARPPLDVVKDVLATPDPRLPIVTRVIEAPFFSKNGTLRTILGYCENSRVYYSPPDGFKIPPIPINPTASDIERAKELLLFELLGDFPFVDPSDKAHAISLMFIPFVRDLIDGPTPLHLIEKPCPFGRAA